MNMPIDISDVVLKTQRLILRPWKQSDLADFFAYASVDGVGQMAGWSPHKDKEETQKILDSFVEGKKTFALQYQGRVIGSLGIEKYDEKKFPELSERKCREIGYVLAKDHWGQGLMAEAVKEVIRYLFEETDLELILCGHFLSNRQSARVQEKCGFHHYAYGTYETRFNTIEKDETNILYKEEWLANMKEEKIEERIEELLQKPYWIIDILPKQVPKDSPGQYFTIENYFLDKDRFFRIKQKHIDLILKLNCYYQLRIADEDTADPDPKHLVEEMSRRYLYIFVDDAMILSEADDTHLTLFNPDQKLLDLIRMLAEGEGLYVWQPPTES